MSQLHTGRIVLHPMGGIGGIGGIPQPLAAAGSAGVSQIDAAANSVNVSRFGFVIRGPLCLCCC